MSYCPKKEKLSMLVKESSEEEVKVTEYRVNPLRLNALLKEEESAPMHNGLMYVDIMLNNYPIQAMIDTALIGKSRTSALQ